MKQIHVQFTELTTGCQKARALIWVSHYHHHALRVRITPVSASPCALSAVHDAYSANAKRSLQAASNGFAGTRLVVIVAAE